VNKLQRGRGMGRVFQNYPNDVYREHNRHKHHLYKKHEEDQSPSVDYIFVAMNDNLDNQTTHAMR
jgi:hypothetical protein